MKAKPTLMLMLCAVIMLAVVKLTPRPAGAQSHAPQSVETQTPIPHGDWSVSIGVYTGADAASLPVIAYSVTSDAPKGLSVTNIKLLNRSPKALIGVKFHWMIFNTQDLKTVLLEGQSDLVSVALKPDGRKSLSFTVGKSPFSFAKVHKPLLQYGFLSGSYRVNILVDEVSYDDGSTWRWKNDITPTSSYRREGAAVKIAMAGLTQNAAC